ncbi:MAG: response regulator, partial [Spirulinaceae cyanobacterium]
MAENTVLLLEDDPTVRGELKTMLPGGKFKLLEVNDSKTALEVIKREVDTLRLMVIKFKMPKIPGWKLVKKAQEQPKLQGIPMVLVASPTDAVSKAFPEPPEFFEIVQYPCDRPTMLAAVKAAMTKAKRPRAGVAATAQKAPPPPLAAKKKGATPPP